MWEAGATAVTIQGQRLISTTGIKCEGNQVTLHGVPYSPPYVIVGIGDQAAISAGADHRPDPGHLPRLHPDPRRQRHLGRWAPSSEAVAPAYEGLLDLTWATPMAS